jgi:hypothetical protein
MRGGIFLAAALTFTACSQPVVPDFGAPNPDATSRLGMQTLVSGLFSGSRNDVGFYAMAMTAFARDAGNFTQVETQFITEFMGDGTPLLPADLGGFVWSNEFVMARAADSILVSLGRVNKPAPYSAGERAQITGIVQTMKALDYMYLAETRDTTGVPLAGVGQTNFGTPAPILCNKDVWRSIVALLDSANAQLNVDTLNPLPVIVPTGFASVSGTAGPSMRAGSFAAFNRALAGKANLELAYAIARSTPATAPTPTSSGLPDAAALRRADSALLASALYQPSALTAPMPGPFSDPNAVYHSFSPASGDVVNPVNANIGTYRMMNEFVAQVDTAHDARWKAKFTTNPAPAQVPQYSDKSSSFIFTFYPSAASPMPIVRAEELVLGRAQVRLGLGDFAGAWGLINQVRTLVGGLPPLAATTDFVSTRDALMREQRISTTMESSADRAIAIRMYGLAAVADTTWGGADLHTTVFPLPTIELTGRTGHLTPVCQ